MHSVQSTGGVWAAEGSWSGATKGRFVVGGAECGVFVKLELWQGGP